MRLKMNEGKSNHRRCNAAVPNKGPGFGSHPRADPHAWGRSSALSRPLPCPPPPQPRPALPGASPSPPFPSFGPSSTRCSPGRSEVAVTPGRPEHSRAAPLGTGRGGVSWYYSTSRLRSGSGRCLCPGGVPRCRLQPSTQPHGSSLGGGGTRSYLPGPRLRWRRGAAGAGRGR